VDAGTLFIIVITANKNFANKIVLYASIAIVSDSVHCPVSQRLIIQSDFLPTYGFKIFVAKILLYDECLISYLFLQLLGLLKGHAVAQLVEAL
jgi:hypothetical protein